MSITALSESIKVSASTISSWENGKTYPRASALYALIKFFAVRADYLLGLTDNN